MCEGREGLDVVEHAPGSTTHSLSTRSSVAHTQSQRSATPHGRSRLVFDSDMNWSAQIIGRVGGLLEHVSFELALERDWKALANGHQLGVVL
eukprot:3051564-Rhodomonas_salina.2